jgi:hypothetical protein
MRTWNTGFSFAKGKEGCTGYLVHPFKKRANREQLSQSACKKA